MIVVDAMNLGYLLLSHPSFSEDVREMARVDDEWCAPPLWRSELRNTRICPRRRPTGPAGRGEVDDGTDLGVGISGQAHHIEALGENLALLVDGLPMAREGEENLPVGPEGVLAQKFDPALRHTEPRVALFDVAVQRAKDPGLPSLQPAVFGGVVDRPVTV